MERPRRNTLCVLTGQNRVAGAAALLGAPVDLVTDKALRVELRPFIEKEAVDV